jgi:4,5-dihydroxyphthalate decarboxylase
MSKIRLTLGCGDYEIVRPLMEGSVQPDGIELTVLTDMTSDVRHWRMIRNREFDVCELSMSSYLMAKDRNQGFTAIPAFLHRRFRHGFTFVNTTKGIERPGDLIGRKVGLRNYQATTNLWVRGILEHEYQTPHKKIRWFTQDDEDVDFTRPPDLSVERIPAGKSVEAMLVDGELDALIHPEVPHAVMQKDKRVKRLFENYKELEIEYYRKTNIFPIMHAVAIRQEIVDRYPWIPINLMQAFERAKQIAYKRAENPRRVPLAWVQSALEEQEDILGKDPWVYGLGSANRRNLETLIGYSHEQSLIAKKIPVDDLFVESTR